ncbi:MAG: hypothetical protein KIT09_07050 [Bryobacteraceae bacterium]|nr:hypothetical protein [Bryobacteraceae bacterium]
MNTKSAILALLGMVLAAPAAKSQVPVPRISSAPQPSAPQSGELERIWAIFREDKAQAESELRLAMAKNPEDRRLAANLGFLYALELLGLDSMRGESSAEVSAADRERVAGQARRELETQTNPAVLAGAGAAIPNIAMRATAGGPVDPELFRFATRLNQRARKLAPNDAEISGPMPMIPYFEEALRAAESRPQAGPRGVSPIMTAGAEKAKRAMEEDRKRWQAAARDIRRLMPRAFPNLPPAVTHDLDRRACLIPQTAYDQHPHNVVSGEFARRGQTDWAVLCSVNGASTILVFWRGETRDVAQIAPGEDLGSLQGMGEGRIGYSRMIGVADRKFILDHYHAYGGVTPPEIDHVGINDAFVEKASVVHYFHQGQWLRLTGAD